MDKCYIVCKTNEIHLHIALHAVKWLSWTWHIYQTSAMLCIPLGDFFPSSDSGRLENWKGDLLIFPQLSHGIMCCLFFQQALVCTLFKSKITEVRSQLHYSSAKSWILLKSPGVVHPLGCFQNDHAANLRDKLLLARNTKYLYCKSIAYEMWLHQHLHTMWS